MSNLETYHTQVVDLLHEGVPPEKLARVFHIPLEHIEAIPAARTIKPIDPEDISTEVSKVISLVIDEAHAIIQNGTPAMKLRLIQAILGKAMMQMRNQSPKAMEELRNRLDALTSGIVNDPDIDED